MIFVVFLEFLFVLSFNIQLLDECSSDGDCEAGLYCFSCPQGFSGSRCVRSTITDQFKLLVSDEHHKLSFLCLAHLSNLSISVEPVRHLWQSSRKVTEKLLFHKHSLLQNS